MALRALIFLVIIMVAGCSGNKEKDGDGPNQEKIVIRGTLKNGADQLVTLDLMGVSAFIPIDSTRCNKEGEFSFAFKERGMNYYSLKHTESGYITLIAEPGDSILITGSANTTYPYSIEGSQDSELVMKLALAHKKALDRLHDISKETEMIIGDADFRVKKQQLNKEYDSVAQNHLNNIRVNLLCAIQGLQPF